MLTLEDYKRTFVEYINENGPEFDQHDIENFSINYVYNSAAIEGNTFTYDQTYTFLKTGEVIPGKSYDEHAELKDLQKAFTLMRDFAINQVPLSEGLVLAIHKQVQYSTNPKHAGKYKETANRVGKYSTPYPEKAKALFLELIDSYKSMESSIKEGKLHPLELAAKIHLDTVLIHPFLDGNGRTARLLTDYTLIKNNHPPFIYQVADRNNYINAIVRSRETKNHQPFTAYVIDQATHMLKEKVDYLKNKSSYIKPQKEGGDYNIFEETGGKLDF